MSVPGNVFNEKFYYLPMLIGMIGGYVIIAAVLVPLYYKMNLTSIYTYLDKRFGNYSYKTGASFFIISRLLGATVRTFLVVFVLFNFVLEPLHIPFWVAAVIFVLLAILYTMKGGVKTIIWTDTLQTICFIAMLIVIIWQVKDVMHTDSRGLVQTLIESPHFRIFEFSDWHSTQHFVKQFLSGIFIVIVMTGLDQDMMQKNLSCKTLKESQKNMYWYGFAFTPVNFLFLSLGVLPAIVFFSASKLLRIGGNTAMRPPLNPLPR
jgi:Na+/proline symporter